MTGTTRPASRMLFGDGEAQILGEHGSRTWVVRGGNFIVAYTQAKAGDTFERTDSDEHFVYIVQGEATLGAGGRTSQAGARSISIMPAGPGDIHFKTDGCMVRAFSSQATDLIDLAANRDVYGDNATDYAPLEDGPSPLGDKGLRTYRLDDYADRRMRLFRCQNLMMNVFDHAQPRDTGALTPHSHQDFEQASLAIAGDWMHHLRRPWGPDMAQWRDDEHLAIGSPSLVVIPARMIHTSRSTNQGYAQLVDVFAPARADFITQGFVCNAEEYPAPAAMEGTTAS